MPSKEKPCSCPPKKKPKKKIDFIVKKKKEQPKAKPKAKPKIKFVVKEKEKAKPKPKKKMAPIKFKVVEKKKPKINFTVKKKQPKAKTEIEKFTGLDKGGANKLDTLALFGMLPPELRKTILTPKVTGVLVGGTPKLTMEAIRLLNDTIETYKYAEEEERGMGSFKNMETGNFTPYVNDLFETQETRIRNASQVKIGGKFKQLNEVIYDDIMGRGGSDDKFRRAVQGHIDRGEFRDIADAAGAMLDGYDTYAPYLHVDMGGYYMNLDDDERTEKYGLIGKLNENVNYYDLDYYTSNRTRSTIRKLGTRVSGNIKKYIKNETLPLVNLIKSGKAFEY